MKNHKFYLVMTYKCKICRVVLFASENLMEHSKMQENSNKKCSSIFIEKPTWIENVSEHQGHIYCPKCKKKIGEWQWFGEQCDCKVWITPSFKISRSKVDEPVIDVDIHISAPYQG
jgi:dual specificity phosphatase 12